MSNDWISLIVTGNLFHRETTCGKNEYLYISVLAYGTEKFLSCDDLVAVMGAGAGMLSVGMHVSFTLYKLEERA